MIQLELQSYCQQCQEFEASTSKSALFANGVEMETTYTISCIHSKRCAALVNYLEGNYGRDRGEKTI